MKRLLFCLSAVVMMLALGVAGVLLNINSNRWQFGESFIKIPTKLEPYALYDIGVAKIDADNQLDIFTVNHSGRQQVLFGNSKSAYMSEIGLGQVRGFSGAEAFPAAPKTDQPGLHLYRKDPKLHVVTHQLDKLGLLPPFSVSIELPWPMVLVSSENASVEMSQKKARRFLPDEKSTPRINEKPIYVADISFMENSEVVLAGEQGILELPHNINVLDDVLRQHIYIGGGERRKISLPIQMLWRDRHSMIWRDIDNDNDSDVFISRGGVQGQLASVPARIQDEFLVRQGYVANDVIEDSGIEKKNCPGRQSAWTDANNDGALDIHISCGRVAFEDPHPDQLYIKTSEQYKDVAKNAGLDYEGVSVFKWADFDIDGDLDLFSAQSRNLVLFTNNGGVFNETVYEDILQSKPTQIVVTDIDHDADLDVFVVQNTGSVALLNTANTFSVQAPATLGLPSQLKTMSVVDFDNDGYADVHLVPGGLFRAISHGLYEKTNSLMGAAGIQAISEARCVWVDQDMNGLLDPTCAVRYFPQKLIRVWKKGVQKIRDPRYWISYAASNESSSANNWLQLDLRASALNAEGIGAVVSLSSNGHTQIASVGQSDSAHYSQGHYRLYFGLGNSKDIDALTVYWPGGEQEEYSIGEVNKLVQLSQTSIGGR